MSWPYTNESPKGEFASDWKPTKSENPSYKCRFCGSDDVWYMDWESSNGAWHDLKYECRGCGQVWWYESDDA